MDDIGLSGWEVESAEDGVAADSVASRSGVGVEAEGALQASAISNANVKNQARRVRLERVKIKLLTG